jgi:hypothetical protein
MRAASVSAARRPEAGLREPTRWGWSVVTLTSLGGSAVVEGAKLHWFPVASMPPSGPPEHDCASANPGTDNDAAMHKTRTRFMPISFVRVVEAFLLGYTECRGQTGHAARRWARKNGSPRKRRAPRARSARALRGPDGPADWNFYAGSGECLGLVVRWAERGVGGLAIHAASYREHGSSAATRRCAACSQR